MRKFQFQAQVAQLAIQPPMEPSEATWALSMQLFPTFTHVVTSAENKICC